MLDLTEPSAIEPGAAPALREHVGQAGQLGGVADAGGGAVRLDAGGRRRVDTGAVQARSTASRWPTGLGAVMPLPLPSLEPPTPSSTA